MEMADLILVNKADGDLKSAATRTCADYAGALRLLRKRAQDPEGYPKAMTVSALEEHGLSVAWEAMCELNDWRRANGHFDGTRARQARHWFAEDVRQGLLARLQTGEMRSVMDALAAEVEAGQMTPSAAAAEALEKLGG